MESLLYVHEDCEEKLLDLRATNTDLYKECSTHNIVVYEVAGCWCDKITAMTSQFAEF